MPSINCQIMHVYSVFHHFVKLNACQIFMLYGIVSDDQAGTGLGVAVSNISVSLLVLDCFAKDSWSVVHGKHIKLLW